MIFSISLAKSFSPLLNLNTATVGPPYREGPITRLFFMYFIITGVKKISRYVEVPTISDGQNINLFEWFAPTLICLLKFFQT